MPTGSFNSDSSNPLDKQMQRTNNKEKRFLKVPVFAQAQRRAPESFEKQKDLKLVF